MKRTLRIIAVATIMLGMVSCTKQMVTRKIDGKMDVTLPKGEKLMTTSWRGSNLFYLTEPMDSGYVSKRKIFRESSGFGIVETEITFIESK